MATVRAAAVAGSFYPGDTYALRAVVREYLDAARETTEPRDPWPKALIVPHAGYMYSGPVAASAFIQIEASRERVSRVVLIGPSHHIWFAGLAVPSSTAFHTPLGSVDIDETARQQILRFPFVDVLDDAHHREHSLEVQLPFLQELLGDFAVLPIAVGRASPAQVEEVLEALWGGEETLIVVSSDLSHYFDYDTAKRMDTATASAIESLEPQRIHSDDACGRIGMQGLLKAARRHGLIARTLDLRSSGDTAGGREEVVGYGAWELTAARNGSP
ncbi:MAG: AmmeMemoRadiSam system protein B [Myxococcales bacterium]|nr:AmmeMemoRadiSam system protein B [Myxococcales bacterium]